MTPDRCSERKSIDTVSKILAESNHVIALIGAGLSSESGIPSFWGPGGLWTKIGEPPLNGYEAFKQDPGKWWRQNIDEASDPTRTKFRHAIDNAQPNYGHTALVQLESIGVLKHQITQNGDNLHFKAGSKAVTEIHGNRNKLRCVVCELRWNKSDFPSGDIEATLKIAPNNLYPTCPECNGIVKTDTVMFGEPIPEYVMKECFYQTNQSDCILVIGTSATVYPAASFPERVKNNGGLVIEANPNETTLSNYADHVLRGPTGKILPILARKTSELLGRG